ncbi:hypothetical protein V1517DRAFT_376629 [Lipomyces orientalis]|uniref:Uncharacterized protein n=1 Tax=Lipomyces orientalis TaxID=1233043 RepID=A0ACC3TF29_9ASCO
MQLSLFLDNPVVCVGSPLTGTVHISLDEPTSITDICVRFKGISFTARMVNNGQSTYRVTERHSHADITISLFDHPRGTILTPGEHIRLFTVQVPVFSECTCLAHCDQYNRFRFSCWTCRHTAVDVGLVRTALPPTCRASHNMYVDYRLVASVDRPGIFKWKTSVSNTVTVVPATLVHASDPRYGSGITNTTTEYKMVIHSAKCDKLPESYFVPGALPRVSGLKKLFSFSSKNSYIDVPIEAEMILYNNSASSLGEHLPLELYISVKVDDISRIAGILNIKLNALKVVLRSKTSGYAQRYPNCSTEKNTLLQHNNLDIPLTSEKSEGGGPRFRIDDKVFKSIELGNHIVPDFDIMGLRHRHKIGAAIGLSFNDGSTRTIEISRSIVINSGIDYDLDTSMLLPPRYQIGDYKYEHENATLKFDDDTGFFD